MEFARGSEDSASSTEAKLSSSLYPKRASLLEAIPLFLDKQRAAQKGTTKTIQSLIFATGINSPPAVRSSRLYSIRSSRNAFSLKVRKVIRLGNDLVRCVGDVERPSNALTRQRVAS